jgi:GAF domain-containing protein
VSTQSYQLMAAEIAQLRDENRQLRDQLHQHREFMAALMELDRTADRVRSDEELVHLLSRILIEALTIVESQDGSLALLDDEAAELQFVIVHGDAAASLTGYRMPSNQGIAGWVVINQQPVRIENARLDERFWPYVDQATGFHTRSLLAVPLIGDDRVLGVVEVVNKREDVPFDELDEALMTLFCRFSGQALSALDRDLPAAI